MAVLRGDLDGGHPGGAVDARAARSASSSVSKSSLEQPCPFFFFFPQPPPAFLGSFFRCHPLSFFFEYSTRNTCWTSGSITHPARGPIVPTTPYRADPRPRPGSGGGRSRAVPPVRAGPRWCADRVPRSLIGGDTGLVVGRGETATRPHRQTVPAPGHRSRTEQAVPTPPRHTAGRGAAPTEANRASGGSVSGVPKKSMVPLPCWAARSNRVRTNSSAA